MDKFNEDGYSKVGDCVESMIHKNWVIAKGDFGRITKEMGIIGTRENYLVKWLTGNKKGDETLMKENEIKKTPTSICAGFFL